MLKLTGITKEYKAASGSVHALKGVSLEFRASEFVCVLGPSGCGKTTLLNIIGGLDHYTSGDLVIQGKSTKDFKDRDWDVYRNHRIGFIFQSYNLIPHQTVLGNVELALTIAGVGREERRRRAAEALARVGLGNELSKKPNQLSGGQMQRVAIARALVNNPDILLADEPTGALDSETSVQIMELIKEIAGERLVIMVTHNPELAYQYASRIVRLKDGLVESDSNPYAGGGNDFTDAEIAPSDGQPTAEQSAQPSEVAAAESGSGRGEDGKKARAKMSFLTSLALSFRNLLTKKGRTILTSVAGSIGIVSVCLVLALSSGFNNYVKKTEEDMLSYYPVTVTESAFDMASIMTSFTSPQDMPDLEQIGDKVYVDSFLTSLADGMTIRNNITDEYLAYLKAADPSWYSAIQYGYGATVVNNLFTNVKTEDKDGNLVQTTRSLSNLKEYYINVVQTKASEYGNLVGFADFFGDVVNVMPGTTDFVSESYSDYVLSQYDVIEGSFPANEHEIVLVVGTNNQVSDLTLAQLGFLDEEKFLALFQAGEDDSEGISDSALVDFSEIIGKEYTLYYNDAVYSENPDYAGIVSSVLGEYPFSYSGTRTSGDLSAEENEGITLKISGILRLKEGLTYGCLTSGLNFTEALVQEYIAGNKQSAIVDWLQNDSSFTITQEMADQYPGLGLEDYVGVTFYISPSNNLNEDYFSNIQGTSLYCTYDLETVVRALGGNDTVTSIAIYATDFDGKEQLLSYLDAWNAAHDESEQITYSDTVGLLMGMVQQILDIITYVLVAFTAISLVVSSVMIGIITYVSVVERVKEIGVLRSLGARKQDIRNLFNAETFIIGLAAGIIGVALSYFISIFINITIQSLAGIAGIAALPFTTALLMVAISIVLTLISGLIPAQSAAKKDPVIALRTE
ncbi:MAG TPA: ABC transporter ATP-binding protein/permease [Firmicutes bacterium]|nr:ABC transporter ATP-binding protein/permease [Bacillota bacterium]